MVYVLIEESNNKIWGVFSDTVQLADRYLNISELDPTKKLIIKEYLNNTNIVKITLDKKQEVVKLASLTWELEKLNSDDSQGSGETDNYPKEIKREVEKVKVKYNLFKENFATFHRLIEDNVVSLDSKLEQVPFLFQDKFEIYRDIIQKGVPIEDAFSYFMDRYQPPDNVSDPIIT